jgi:hypothetical protein
LAISCAASPAVAVAAGLVAMAITA